VKQRWILPLLTLALVLAVPGLTSAQFGHPLKGQWSGQWGPASSPVRLLLDLQWDGKQITGTINPGAGDAAAVKSVTLDYSNPAAWKVVLQAEGKDASGKPAPITVDGTLENIGAYAKLLHGTWTQGGRKGEFTLTRN